MKDDTMLRVLLMANTLEEFELDSECAVKMAVELDKMGFMQAPASLGFHGNWVGGLKEHSLAVADELLRLTDCLQLRWEKERSPWLVGLLHDLCKVEDYEVQDGVWVHKEPRLEGHGVRSEKLATDLLARCGMEPLTVEEMLCIRWHMGFADKKENWNGYGEAVETKPNVLWIHTADMYAARVQGV